VAGKRAEWSHCHERLIGERSTHSEWVPFSFRQPNQMIKRIVNSFSEFVVD